MTATRNLAGFTGSGYEVGRPKTIQALWLFISGAIFMRWWCPARLRVAILRVFGASVGDNVLIRHRVRIHWPWKLTIGNNSWVGEGVWLLNLEEITIGNDVCISQEAFLCTGSHDRRSATFEFDNAPIAVGDGAWIAARASIFRGVSIGANVTVRGASVVWNSIPDTNFRGEQ